MVAHLISLEALVGFDKGIPYLHFFFIYLISLEALVGFDKGIPYLHFFFILLWRY